MYVSLSVCMYVCLNVTTCDIHPIHSLVKGTCDNSEKDNMKKTSESEETKTQGVARVELMSLERMMIE